MADQHRPFRLDPSVYAVPGTFALITANTLHREKHFSRPDVAEMAVDVLIAHARRRDVPVYAYCFMPDHMHLVIAPSATCGIDVFVSQVKSLIARGSWPLGVHRTPWQESFRDDIERNPGEELWGDVRYVLRNPFDDGLVTRWEDYPYLGSTVFTREQLREIFENIAFARRTPGSRYAPLPEPD